MSNHILVVTGDHHANSTVGLCPPTVSLDDGGYYHASAGQRWIWNCWLTFWRQVQKLKDQSNCPITWLILGEIADDLKHSKTQLITTNPADIIEIGLETITHQADLVDELIVIRGTEAHTGPSACLDEEIARRLLAKRSPSGTMSHWEFRGEFSGVVIDAQHHPAASSRVPHTRGNEAGRLASRIFYEYSIDNIIRLRTGRDLAPWPHLVLRGHNHWPADSGDNQPGGHPVAAIRAIITPSWQLPTAFGYRLGGGRLPIGGLIITCCDGRFTVHKIYFLPQPAASEVTTVQ